jgi:GT2 family glycosyltransferase
MTPVVIIVNFNSGNALSTVLHALRHQTHPLKVTIVDNASTDDSLQRAHEADPSARISPLRHNSGFARAFNYGLARIEADDDIVVALNPDTLPRPEFIAALIAPLQDDLSIASVAGTLTFATAPDVIASAGIAVHRNGVAIDARLGQRLRDSVTPQPVFGASGGAAAYRVRALRSVGGMCEAFFMYLEDVDLAWRLRLAGWEAVWSPGAVATHDYSGAAGEGSPFKRRLLARNRLWTLARCLPAEIWHRDRSSILAFDLAAGISAVPRRDLAALRGRAEGFIGLPLRLHERAAIQGSATVMSADLDRWVKPPISPGELLRLRALTGRLAKRS